MAVKTLDKKLATEEYEQHLLSKKLISRVPNRTGNVPKVVGKFQTARDCWRIVV